METSPTEAPPAPAVTPAASPDLGRELVRQLAEARQIAAHLDATWRERLTAFEATHADLLTARRDAATLAAQREDELRAYAVARYTADGERHPAPGVGIRITTTAEIQDEAAAIAWAKVSGVGLTLDERAVKKIALAAPGSLPFVHLTVSATATVTADLEAALAGGVQ